MDVEHHCNRCPNWYVTKKKYPSGYYNITICKRYHQQLFYLAGEENQTPHPCKMCQKKLDYIPFNEADSAVGGSENMGEIKLKPCPFCGREAHIIETYCKDTNFRGYNVHHNCNKFMNLLMTSSFDTPEEAAEVWNDRAGQEVTKE